MVTPLTDRDALDVAGLERLVAHILTGGVHGLFILGTTGEGPSLSHRLQRELVDRTIELVAGRVPVFVGVTDPSFEESVRLACYAADAGAAAVVVSAPYFFPFNQRDLINYVHQIVSEIPLPVLLYNLPAITKVWFDVETVTRLMSIDQVVGLKDSSENLKYFEEVCRATAQRDDWAMLLGADDLLAESIRLGGHGGVTGGANVFPSLFVALYESAIARDTQQVGSLHAHVLELYRLYGDVPTSLSVIRALKCALRYLGICSDVMANPVGPFGATERALAETHVSRLATSIENTLASRPK